MWSVETEHVFSFFVFVKRFGHDNGVPYRKRRDCRNKCVFFPPKCKKEKKEIREKLVRGERRVGRASLIRYSSRCGTLQYLPIDFSWRGEAAFEYLASRTRSKLPCVTGRFLFFSFFFRSVHLYASSLISFSTSPMCLSLTCRLSS